MNKKIIISTATITVIAIFAISIVSVLFYQKRINLNLSKVALPKIQTQKYRLSETVTYDYNKNILKTFPAPYAKTGGLSSSISF